MEVLLKYILLNPLSCLTTNRVSKIIQDTLYRTDIWVQYVCETGASPEFTLRS